MSDVRIVGDAAGGEIKRECLMGRGRKVGVFFVLLVVVVEGGLVDVVDR